jgi:AcrR family transcriptional regulator
VRENGHDHDPVRTAGLAAATSPRAERILEAATRAVVRRGLGSTRIADIAREAGTSTGTIHYHFETKDDVLVAALTWANRESYEFMRQALANETSSAARLGRLIDLSIPYPGIQRDWWVLWIELWVRVLHRPELRERSEELSQRWRRHLLDVIHEGTRSGEFRPIGEPDDVTERLVALIDGLAFQVVVEHHWMPPARMRALVLRHASDELRVPVEALGALEPDAGPANGGS